ncbi:MAG: rhomboid family intramembrane serine protease [Lachnospiraceae bacterium]|nr:rhomboid family intramembrane serine protease [Lachnospiraceae bacterium]MBQ8548730.1 rhomboid family intramembrane serine protease [Lachnospiraceae bacterium]
MRESWTEMRIKSRKATLTIAVLNILAFITNLVLGGGSFFGLFISGGGYLKEYGEVAFNLITEQGQWWRLLTCGYLHMGIIHLVGNMVALQIVGNKVEEKTGLLKTLLLYNFGTMLTAFLWCLIFRNGTIIGASLGIFVLLGMACVWCRKGQEKQRVCFSLAEKRYLIIYTIVGCFLGIGTIAVHAIGFLIGMSVGGIYGKIIYSRAKSE